MSTKYAIRQAIVLTLFRFYCPQELNTVLLDDRMLALEADPALILREWDALTEAGYLESVPGYPKHRSLAVRIRKHLEEGKSFFADPFMAGPAALR